MGKHKHRRREREENYVQEQSNNGYVGGYNGNNPINNNMAMNAMNMAANLGAMGMNNPMGMNNQMGMNNPMGMMGMNNQMGMNNPMGMMNGSNPLASLLGGMGGGNFNGILDLINSLGIGGESSGNNGGDLIGMISSLLGGSGASNSNNNINNDQSNNYSSIEQILSQIKPEDIEQLKVLLDNMTTNNENQESMGETREVKKKAEESVEEILANLDFNAILNNMNNTEFSRIDFSNIDLNNLDIDDIIKDDELSEENITIVDEADIIEENIFRDEKGLTQEEYNKLINMLIRLIDPNKIKLLQKILDEYNNIERD